MLACFVKRISSDNLLTQLDWCCVTPERFSCAADGFSVKRRSQNRAAGCKCYVLTRAESSLPPALQDKHASGNFGGKAGEWPTAWWFARAHFSSRIKELNSNNGHCEGNCVVLWTGREGLKLCKQHGMIHD